MPIGKIEELEKIISSKDLHPVFQPIFNIVQPAILGYEALIRGPADSMLHNPIVLFQTANQVNLITALEYACRDISCEYFAHLKLPGKLFLNVSPMSFIDNHHKDELTKQIINKHNISADRIVMELSEQYPMDDFEIIKLATQHYRSMGFEIAIDDLGSGYAGLRIWSEIRPEYVKIDRHFVEDVNEDTRKKEFVRSICEISRGLYCKVIAEGIETKGELEILNSIGVELGQGDLLGRANKNPTSTIPNQLLVNNQSFNYITPTKLAETVEGLVDHTYSIAPTMSLEDSAELFKKDPLMLSAPVVDESDVPLGIITRRKIMEIFLNRFGKDFYARRTVREFMEIPIIVENTTPIQEVSRVIADNLEIDISTDFIIVQRGKYIGIGRFRNLLARITEMQIRSARYANPLTLLPGNVPIYERIEGLFKKSINFYIAYCDINNFKPFNDKYGYSCGDEVILKVSEILQENINTKSDFIGHIGGDDFVVIFSGSDWEPKCKNILNNFEEEAPKFYNSEDRKAGGINSIDRRGDEQFFPILSLAIGVVNPDRDRCVSHHDVSALASDAKNLAKKMGGNALFISRRKGRPDVEYDTKIKDL